jgi:DNA-binding transcriptional ArsR family regulator
MSHDAVFSALSDPTRRAVVTKLSKAPASASTLAASMPVTRQAITKHLAALQEAGLVTAERRGREVLYRLTPRPMADAMTWMADVGAQWDRRLETLRIRLGHRRG